MNTFIPASNYYSQQSDRLLFRSFRKEDVQLWEAFFISNPTMRFLGMENLKISNEEKATKWIGKQIEREKNEEYGQLAVLNKKNNQLIGVGGIIARELNGLREFEITYSLLPKFWGNGYATELAEHFKKYAFANIDISSVISIIHIENNASIRVALKNGMVENGKTTFMKMPVYIFRIER